VLSPTSLNEDLFRKHIFRWSMIIPTKSKRKNMAERVLYKSLIALPMPLGPLLVPVASVPTGQASDHAPDHKG